MIYPTERVGQESVITPSPPSETAYQIPSEIILNLELLQDITHEEKYIQSSRINYPFDENEIFVDGDPILLLNHDHLQ